MKIINNFLTSDPLITIISIVTPRWDNLKEIILEPLRKDPCFKQVGEYCSVYHKDTDTDGHYNCCKAFNEVVELCSSEIILFSTGDGLIPSQLLWRGYGMLLLHDLPVFAYRMDEQEEGSWKKNNDALGEFIMVRREWALESTWDERLGGWGAMDYDFLQRVCNNLLEEKDRYNYIGVCLGPGENDRVKHFYHPRKSDEWYRAQNDKNWGIIEEQGLWNKGKRIISERIKEGRI